MPETGFGEIFNRLPDDRQIEIAAKCDSQACRNARDSVITSRNSAAIACSEVKRLEGERNVYAAIASGLGAAATALWIAAAAAPWPVNLVLAIIASALTIAAIVFRSLMIERQVKLDQAKTVLANAQRMFTDAVAAVMRDCDSFCYPDMTIETCL